MLRKTRYGVALAVLWLAMGCIEHRPFPEGEGSDCEGDDDIACECPEGGEGTAECLEDGTVGACECGGGMLEPGDGDEPGPRGPLRIELTWTTPSDPDALDNEGADLDLWLIHPDAEGVEDPRGRCYWRDPQPDWGVVGEREDDPVLEIDATDGHGSEVIALATAADTGGAPQFVGVHYFRDWFVEAPDVAVGASLATVRIFVGEEPVFEARRELLAEGDLWIPATIEWIDGRPVVAADGDVFESVPAVP